MVFQISFLTWSFTRAKILLRTKIMSRSTEQQLLLQSTLPNLIIGVVGELLLTVGHSVKSAVELRKRELFSVMLVKTAHKNFLQTLLAEASLQRGEWQSCTTKMIDGTNLQAVRFVDLQTKDFILTCSTAIPGLPRKTKHQGLVQHPQAADST